MKEFHIDCDGIKLHSKLDFPEGLDETGKGPLCILVHGFTGHMEEDHIIAAQKAMNSAGLAVLRVEMYGHGKSDGKFEDHTIFKWVTNALAVVKYAKSLEFVTDLYMSGHSQGGFLTMLIAGMCPDDFKAIVPLSPAVVIPDDARRGSMLNYTFDPDHIPDMLVSGEWRLCGDYARVAQTLHPDEDIVRFRKQVVIITGVDDEVIPITLIGKKAELYENAKLIPIEGANHCFVGHIDDLSDAVLRTFAELTA